MKKTGKPLGFYFYKREKGSSYTYEGYNEVGPGLDFLYFQHLCFHYTIQFFIKLFYVSLSLKTTRFERIRQNHIYEFKGLRVTRKLLSNGTMSSV